MEHALRTLKLFMKKRLIILCALTIGVVFLAGRMGGGRGESTLFQEVVLAEEGFVPREVYLARGGTVVFSTKRGHPFWPASNLHPQHDIYPAFDPKSPLNPDEVWAFTFNEAGTFGYHDHLRAYFNGVIYVE